MAKLNSSEAKVLDEIAGWKGRKPSFLNRATEVVSKPLNWLTAKLIPENVRSSVSGITESIAEKLQDLSHLTVDKETVLKATREFEIDSETVVELRKASIFDLDNVSKNFIEDNTRMAAVSGAGTGLVGWPGLIADLPTLFMLSVRTIHQIGICYGYDMDTPDQNGNNTKAYEMGYIMQVFKVATSADMVEKQKALSEIRDYELGHSLELQEGMSGDFTAKNISKNATAFVSTKLIKEIVEQTISKKAAALIPGLGAVFNAGFNYVYLQDVGEAAFMLYRERFLRDKKGRKRVINIEIE